MPKKPRKARAKTRKGSVRNRVRNKRELLTTEEVGQRQQTLAASSQQIRVTKPSIVTTEQDRRHEYFPISDLRRTFLAAGIALLVLIVLYLFLR